ncbi:MAG TPA: hypothetical protein VMZ90_04340 [Vicinamibacterales bacterium]|nr:hypothetical protein [Vicinamibacterales bacterium]
MKVTARLWLLVALVAVGGLAGLYGPRAWDAMRWKLQVRDMNAELRVLVRRTQENLKRADDAAADRAAWDYWFSEIRALLDRNAAKAPAAGRATLGVMSQTVDDQRQLMLATRQFADQAEELLQLKVHEIASAEHFEESWRKLSEIREFMSSARARASALKETHRGRVASSGLDYDTRVVLWQGMQPFFGALDAVTSRFEGPYLDKVKTTQAAVDFLHQHPGSWLVADDGKILFRDVNLLLAYRQIFATFTLPGAPTS